MTPLRSLLLLSLLGACDGDKGDTADGVAAEIAVPSVALVSPANGAVVEQADLDVTIEIVDASAAGVLWRVGGAVVQELAQDLAEGNTLTETLSLSSGSNVVEIEVMAEDGSSDAIEVVFYLDAPDAPIISLLSPEVDAVASSASILLQGDVIAEEVPADATFSVNGAAAELALTEQGGGVWSFTEAVDLAYGVNTIVVEVTDAAGQGASVSREVTRGLDEIDPVIASVWPTDGHSVASVAPAVWIEASDNDAIASVAVVQGGVSTEASLLSDGRYGAALSLSPGANEWSVVVTDDSGNTTSETRSVWLGSRVSAGGSHSGWIRDGALLMWGRNNTGQAGVGYTSSLGDTDPAHPNVPTTVSLDGTPVSLAAYQNTSIVLDDSGALWGFGDNGYGQLGLDGGEVFDDVDRDAPEQIPNVEGVVAIAGGYYHTLALRSDGTVMAFGRNGDGQLGDGGTDNSDLAQVVSGLEDVVQVAAASSTSLAVTADGALYAFGANDYAQLGDGTEDDDSHSAPVLVSGLPPIVQVAAGRDHVIALDAEGQIWGWGLNANNQIGGTDHKLGGSPILVPTLLDHLPTAVAVYANGNQSYLETADGRLWGWGQNGSVGSLGVSIDGDLDEPVESVFGLSGVLDLGVGALHSVTLDSGGQAYAWGWSYEGSLGGGDGLINIWGYRIPILVSAP